MAKSANTEDLNKATPYSAAKARLRNQILAGRFGPGGQLTPELELCRQFNISRSTIRRAITELVEEGLLTRQQGRGTFVKYERTDSQKRLVALLLCRFSHVAGAYDLFLKGAMEEASARRYELLVSNSHNNPFTAIDQVMRLNEIRAAGTVVMPLQSGGDDERTMDSVLQALKGANQHVVLADTYCPDSDFPSISSQNKEATIELTNHLIRLGRRRIAFLTSNRIEPVVEREEGFLQAMQEAGLEVPSHFLLEVAGTDPVRQGSQAVDVFMAMREPPEAIICLHDLIALNVLERCAKRGWRVPEDVAVVGFDDLPAAAHSRPPLTTMHQPLFTMGRQAVGMLIDQLNDVALKDLHPRLPCNLKIRESCGAGLVKA
jgi:GntR family transcriptional regulator of arabinose operon